MIRVFLVALALAAALPAAAAPPRIAGCEVFPADNAWNTRVDNLRVHPSSAAWVGTIGAATATHPDFGSIYGIPFIDVPGSQPRVPIGFDVPGESDAGPYPIPSNAPIEGGSSSSGDRHVIVVERDNCILYELYSAYPWAASGPSGWNAYSGAVFDLKGDGLRPDGWTSADAAGLPILPGLLRYDEFVAGDIRHAIRFTAPVTRNAHLWPARHDASSQSGSQYPPMGARFRLKASFDETPYAPQIRNVLRAMKRYGIILADNGSPWYFSGEQNPAWNDTLLDQLKTLHGSDFEAVDVAPLQRSANSAAAFPPPPAISLRVVASGFLQPTAVAAPPDGSGRLFVLEKNGLVKIVKNGSVLATPFLDVSTRISVDSERGLLGLAFAPDYATSRVLYIYYTDNVDGTIHIARLSASATNADLADAATLADVITIPHPVNANHNGGSLAFGPDGYLYAGVGDGGGYGDVPNNAQNLGVLLGKILRLDVARANGYAVPPDNPFVGTAGARPEIFAYGLRNPWRISFDRLTGDLYIGDVGQDTVEEVDMLPAMSRGGVNFGWHVIEGTQCYNPPTGCSTPANYVPPVQTYLHDAAGGNSVTGGYVYRGLRFPALQGYYVFGDFGSNRIWAAIQVGGAWTRFVLSESPNGVNNLPTFGEDAAGELYVMSFDGVLLAIDSATRTVDLPPPLVGEAARKVDLDRDGHADLTWRHGSGAAGAWLMNGVAPKNAAIVAAPAGASLRLAASLGGATMSPFLAWRHDDGAYSISAMNGLAVVSTTRVLAGGFGWELVGTGDFDGDGQADLLWRSTDDQYGVWLMDGATIRSASTLGTLGAGWEVAFVGRFLGTARTDFLWRHVDGSVRVTPIVSGALGTPLALQGPGTGWRPTQAGDFDNDGATDIVWTHADGRVRLTLTVATPATTGLIGARSGWHVTHAADLDGDGKADLIWSDDFGSYGGWLMNGVTTRSLGVFFSAAGSGWHIASTADFDGDGKADLLWRHDSGAYGGWLMNGLSPTDVRSLLSAGTRWEVAP